MDLPVDRRIPFVILLLSWATSVAWSQRADVPAWLLRLPEEERAVYSVGFSYPYVSPDTTYAHAYDSGIMELGRSFSVQVRSARVNWNENSDDELSYVDRVYGERVDTALLGRVRGAAKVVATFQDHGSRILYLLIRLPVSTESEAPSPGRAEESRTRDKVNLAMIDGGAAPDWLNRLPTEKDAIFAVGYEERYADPTESRMRAIENARAELSRIVRVRVQTMLDAWSERNEGIGSDLNERISRSLSVATLKGSQIVGVWVDPHSGDTYALARMLKKPLSLTIRQETAGRIEGTATKALEDLDRALKEFSPNSRDRQ